MSPCSARTFMPRSRSVRNSWSQRTFVRTNTIAWSGASARRTSTSLSGLLLGVHRQLELRDGVDRQRRRLDLDDGRVVHVAVRELADRRRHRRGEQRGLAARGRQREDLLDVLEEAEVEHLIGLVEHDEAAVVQHQRVARDQVEHAPDRAHHHVPAAAQLGLLGADRRAAEHRHDVHPACVPYVRSACVTWMQSSRVGVSTSACTEGWRGRCTP